jgi:hypothetical protein
MQPPPLMHLPAVVSQVPLMQSVFWVQVPQSGTVGTGVQVHTFWLVSQVKPPQSESLVQPAVQTLVLVSQLPLAQSALVVQAAQSAVEPAGATHTHWLVVMSHEPPGQSALLTHWLAHLPAVVSQLLLAQSPFWAQAEQAGAAGTVQVQKFCVVSQA